jgi:hypothetical protein
VAAPQLGRAQLEEKDRDDLEQIANALGIKGVARANRETLIGKILEETMAPERQSGRHGQGRQHCATRG